MTTKLNPYLNFREGTREVMEFYVSVFGGELTLSTFAESGGMGLDEAEQGKVMHSQLVTGNGMTVMAADVPDSMELGQQRDALAQRRGRGRLVNITTS